MAEPEEVPAADPESSMMRRVRELMEQDLLTLSPEMSLPEAVRLLAARHLDGAPVLE